MIIRLNICVLINYIHLSDGLTAIVIIVIARRIQFEFLFSNPVPSPPMLLIARKERFE